MPSKTYVHGASVGSHPRAAQNVANSIEADIISKAGEGADAEVYIMKLLEPMGRHSEVAVKILSKGTAHGVGGNIDAARRVHDLRKSLPKETAKYLPKILKIGKTEAGDAYIMLEKLDPLPPSIRQLFLGGRGWGAASRSGDDLVRVIRNSPEEYSKVMTKTIDNMLDVQGISVPEDLANISIGTLKHRPPGPSKKIHNLAIKYASDPSAVPAKTRKIVDGFDESMPGYWNSNDVGSKFIKLSNETVKSSAYAIVTYMRKLRHELAFNRSQILKSVDSLKSAGKIARADAATKRAKVYLDDIDEIDDILDNMSKNPMIIDDSMFGISRKALERPEIPSSIHPGIASYEKYGIPGGAANLESPVVQNAFNAMSDLSKAGIVPHDMHVENWLIRPGTGDIVMADVGGFWRGAAESTIKESIVRAAIRKILSETFVV